MIKRMLIPFISIFCFFQGMIFQATAIAAAPLTTVKVKYRDQSGEESLLEELNPLASSLKMSRPSRTAPEGKWKGILFSDLLLVVMKKLSLQQQGDVDLLVFRNQKGEHLEIQRAFLNRNSALLAWKEGAQTPDFHLVVPIVTAKGEQKLQDEVIPWKRVTVFSFNEIVLTNDQYLYDSEYFLGFQKDPTLSRGEKHFVKVCLNCHYGPGVKSDASFISSSLTMLENQQFKTRHHDLEASMLSGLDERSLKKYFVLISKRHRNLASKY